MRVCQEGLIEKLLSMAECLIYESRLLIEDALEDSSLFTSSFSRSSWSLSAQATAVLESRHLSEQFELNMQLLGMEGLSGTKRICCLYRG